MQNLQDRGPGGAEIHAAHRPAELLGEHDEHQRGRDELRDGARRGDDAGGELHVVAVALHHRQRDHRHGDHRGRHRAGDRAEHRADQDDGIGEAAGDLAEELAGAFEQVLGEAAALEDRAHEGEEGDGEQELVGDDAEEAIGQRLQEDLLKCPVTMPITPKPRPSAARVKATGKPIRKNTISAPNISGGMTPYWNM